MKEPVLVIEFMIDDDEDDTWYSQKIKDFSITYTADGIITELLVDVRDANLLKTKMLGEILLHTIHEGNLEKDYFIRLKASGVASIHIDGASETAYAIIPTKRVIAENDSDTLWDFSAEEEEDEDDEITWDECAEKPCTGCPEKESE